MSLRQAASARFPVRESSEPVIAVEEIATARRYADASRAASTQRAYHSDWQRFASWCATRGLDTLPAAPRVVAVFLAAEAAIGSAPLTIGRRLAAIGWIHRRAGLQPPQKREGAAAIFEVIAGIRRSHGVAPVKKYAADADVLRDILRAIAGDDIRSVRDRAVLAFGMAGAFRRSELVTLRVSDIAWVKEGLLVTIRRGKTDQEGAGATIAIPEGRRLRPRALLDAWVQQGGIADGFLFRWLIRGKDGATTASASPMSDRAVARLVQARGLAAGYDPARLAGHSLRAGFLTAAARSGASIFKMRKVSRHKSMQVLANYVRDAELFRDHDCRHDCRLLLGRQFWAPASLAAKGACGTRVGAGLRRHLAVFRHGVAATPAAGRVFPRLIAHRIVTTTRFPAM